eukprot:9791607-Lingulodinium_polyedra.AAC.1
MGIRGGPAEGLRRHLAKPEKGPEQIPVLARKRPRKQETGNTKQSSDPAQTHPYKHTTLKFIGMSKRLSRQKLEP